MRRAPVPESSKRLRARAYMRLRPRGSRTPPCENASCAEYMEGGAPAPKGSAVVRHCFAERLVQRVQRRRHDERVERMLERELPNAAQRIRGTEHHHGDAAHAGAAEELVLHHG